MDSSPLSGKYTDHHLQVATRSVHIMLVIIGLPMTLN